MKQASTNISLILLLTGSLLYISGCTQAPDNEISIKADLGATPEVPDNNTVAVADALTAIHVSFKLDPGLTRGTYMGERWISPPSYDSVQTGGTYTVEVRARVLIPRESQWT